MTTDIVYILVFSVLLRLEQRLLSPLRGEYMNLFIGMVFAHLLADWLFQTEAQAVGKMKGKFFNRASVTHGLTHLVGYTVALWWNDVIVLWALPIALSHMFIDRRWPVVWWIVHVERTRPETVEKLGWLVIVVDQAMHSVILGSMAFMLS